MHELGLLEHFLKVPHTKIGNAHSPSAIFSRLPPKQIRRPNAAAIRAGASSG